MSQDTQQDHISKKRVVYTMPGVDAVTVRRDEEYRVTDGGTLTMDLYYPPDSKKGAPLPAVVIVAGYSDVGDRPRFGKFKEMGWSISWGQLMAASGMLAITYTNREPATDIAALLQYVRRNAASLGVDENRIGVFAGSGNVPIALSVLMQEAMDYLKCAVLCYGFMLDLEGSTAVAEAAKTYGFVNPCAGRSVDDLPRDIPLLIVRAAEEQFPHLNEMIDRFVLNALARSLPVTLVNHPGPHAFDLTQNSETARETIGQMLAFLRFNLVER